MVTNSSNIEKGNIQHISPSDNTQARDTPSKSTSEVSLDWDGPDDLENPHNWSSASRAYHATVPGLFGFVVQVIPPLLLSSFSNPLQHLRLLSLHPRYTQYNARPSHVPYRRHSRPDLIYTRSRLWASLLRSFIRALRSKDCVLELCADLHALHSGRGTLVTCSSHACMSLLCWSDGESCSGGWCGDGCGSFLAASKSRYHEFVFGGAVCGAKLRVSSVFPNPLIEIVPVLLCILTRTLNIMPY
jgi:hypothetical protein